MSSEAKPILIVDSERKSRRILEINLKKAGLDCLGVETARDALSILQDKTVYLIISDTNLPKIDGFEFCRLVKADVRTESIPFVFLTQSRDMADKLKGYELGIDEYITKPAYVREIIGRIKFLMRRRKQELLAEADAHVVTGNLDDITLLDILETIEDGSKTGAIRMVRDDTWGTIYFE